MGWAFVWMMVVLKIPVIAALWLIWWAVKEPEPEDDPGDRGGGPRRDHHPRPPRPRLPRRGPHAEPSPPAPKRVRATGRRLAPARR